MIASSVRPPRPAQMAAVLSEAPSSPARTASWSVLPRGVVDGSEIVLLAIKPSMIRPILESGGWVLLCLTLASVVTWARLSLAGLSVLATAQVLLLLAVARFSFAVMHWASTWYVLTNRRVLDIQGIRTPSVWSCPLVAVRNTYLRVSAAERLGRTGSITFVPEPAGEETAPAPRAWRCVAQPELIHDRIRRAIESAFDQQGVS